MLVPLHSLLPTPGLPDEHLIILQLLVLMPFPREVLPIIRTLVFTFRGRIRITPTGRQPVRQTLYIRTH